jgi:hypothetical protein
MPAPMLLAVYCKKSEDVDLKTPILEYITRNYGKKVRTGPQVYDVRRFHACRPLRSPSGPHSLPSP